MSGGSFPTQSATASEASAGASHSKMMTPAVMDDYLAGMTAGSVGNLAFLYRGAGNVGYGSSYAGSGLAAASSVAGGMDGGGATQSGSWMCLGHRSGGACVTLYRRIL